MVLSAIWVSLIVFVLVMSYLFKPADDPDIGRMWVLWVISAFIVSQMIVTALMWKTNRDHHYMAKHEVIEEYYGPVLETVIKYSEIAYVTTKNIIDIEMVLKSGKSIKMTGYFYCGNESFIDFIKSKLSRG